MDAGDFPPRYESAYEMPADLQEMQRRLRLRFILLKFTAGFALAFRTERKRKLSARLKPTWFCSGLCSRPLFLKEVPTRLVLVGGSKYYDNPR
jgi:hypothetical protein